MTNSDPWATEPEPAYEPPASSYEAPAAPVAAQAAEVVQTIKFGTAFDAPWSVVHGPNPATVNAIMGDPEYRQTIDLTVKIARYAQGQWSGTKTTPDAALRDSNTNSAPRSQPDRTDPPNGEAKYCAHGERSYKEGVSKAGKPYKGYFCTSQDKDNQCSPEWAK